MAYNVRSPEQWAIISKQIDFQGKTVLDLGCGKGDILFCADNAGADVTGIDNDIKNIAFIQNNFPKIEAKIWDIDKLPLSTYFQTNYYTGISICFSVLPYLRRPEITLKWISHHSDIAFIECQYVGDGPGFAFLTDNDAMREWLLVAGQFEKVQPIGHTIVEGRNKKRFIWMCE